MPKKSDAELEKVTLNLQKGDFKFLQTAYPEVGAGRVVRELVHGHVRKVQAEAPPAKLEIEENIA